MVDKSPDAARRTVLVVVVALCTVLAVVWWQSSDDDQGSGSEEALPTTSSATSAPRPTSTTTTAAPASTTTLPASGPVFDGQVEGTIVAVGRTVDVAVDLSTGDVTSGDARRTSPVIDVLEVAPSTVMTLHSNGLLGLLDLATLELRSIGQIDLGARQGYFAGHAGEESVWLGLPEVDVESTPTGELPSRDLLEVSMAGEVLRHVELPGLLGVRHVVGNRAFAESVDALWEFDIESSEARQVGGVIVHAHRGAVLRVACGVTECALIAETSDGSSTLEAITSEDARRLATGSSNIVAFIPGSILVVLAVLEEEEVAGGDELVVIDLVEGTRESSVVQFVEHPGGSFLLQDTRWLITGDARPRGNLLAIDIDTFEVRELPALPTADLLPGESITLLHVAYVAAD